jgi:hypothetical protein
VLAWQRHGRMQLSRLLLPTVAALFVLITLPLIVRGEPLADDFHNCLRPTEIGLGGFLGESASRLGAVRPARFLEIFAIAPLCRRAPFGLIILIPLALTLLVAFLLRGLLRDLDVPDPWPEIGAAVWLLHPVGAEAALWPSALHVPLGLALALGALRLHLRDHPGWGTLAALGAFLSLEQTILALPLAVWMIMRGDGRRRSVILTGVVAGVVSVAYATWAGWDPRSAIPFSERVAGIFKDLRWYAEFPPAGLGLYSIPLALWWAFPLSAFLVPLGAWLGTRLRSALGVEYRPRGLNRRQLTHWALGILVLIILVNLPLMTTVPRGHSPRTFSPTWLILSALLPLVVTRVAFPRAQWVWAGAGAFAVVALLSIALSVSVRLQTEEFTETTSRYLAAQVSDGELIAVCGVRRTVTTPAPLGDFALHQFIYPWAAHDSLLYYTGRHARFRLGGPLWGTNCPRLDGADFVVTFDQLLAVAARDDRS